LLGAHFEIAKIEEWYVGKVTRTRNESRHRWADVLFEDGQALVCLDPKKRGILWAKLQHI